MRIIRVNDDESSGHTGLWILAGAVLGVAAGVLIAERMRGRRRGVRGLLRRARSLAERAVDRWEPLVGAAMAVRDAWSAPDEEELEEELEFEEEEEYADDDDAEGEEEDEEEADAEEEDEIEEDDDEVDEDEDDDLPRLDERVLEAFANDPVLAERAIEIEQTDEGGILLHGQVNAAREVAHAVTIARGVPGVAGVRQRLRVRDRR